MPAAPPPTSWPDAAAVLLPACSAPPLPQGPCPVCPRLAQEFEPWRQAAYYKAMLDRAVAREAQLQQEIATLQAQLRLREQQLFGRKTDSTATADGPARSDRTPRPRGQQRGKPGPQRRDYSHLPAVEQFLELPAEQRCCERCGQPFASFPGTEDATVLEIDVRAHRRIYRRCRYRPTCSCGHHPGIVTAPPPAKVIPKSLLGVSVWVPILLDMFPFYRPTYRLLEDLHTQGLNLSQGTLTDGLQRLLPLFEPVYDHLVEHSQQQPLWHADETRWLVFATWDGKVGHRWYLWVFHATDVVIFVLSPSRSHEVPEEHLGPVEEGILIVDRYAAYQAMAQVKDGTIVLAFCWAHVRRDFLTVARSWPNQEAWALGWVDRIGVLCACNDRRLEASRTTALFTARDQEVRRCVATMEQEREDELTRPELHPARRKVAGEPACALDRPDGVGGAPRGADGQQHGGAVGAWPSGGAQELLGLGSGLEWAVGGDAVLAVPDAGVVGSQPAGLADGVPDGVCGSRWPGARDTGGVVAVEPVGAATPGVVPRAAVGR